MHCLKSWQPTRTREIYRDDSQDSKSGMKEVLVMFNTLSRMQTSSNPHGFCALRDLDCDSPFRMTSASYWITETPSQPGESSLINEARQRWPCSKYCTCPKACPAASPACPPACLASKSPPADRLPPAPVPVVPEDFFECFDSSMTSSYLRSVFYKQRTDKT